MWRSVGRYPRPDKLWRLGVFMLGLGERELGEKKYAGKGSLMGIPVQHIHAYYPGMLLKALSLLLFGKPGQTDMQKQQCLSSGGSEMLLVESWLRVIWWVPVCLLTGNNMGDEGWL